VELRWQLEALWGPALPIAEGGLQQGEWAQDRVLPPTVRKRDRLARIFGLVQQPPWRVPAQGAAALPKRWIDAVLDKGGEVLDGVAIEGFDVEDGRVTAVQTDHGREHVLGRLFVDAPIDDVAEWVELPVDAEQVDALTPAHRIQVTLKIDSVDVLPWLLDTPVGMPFERVTRPGLLPQSQDWWSFVTVHIACSDGSVVWMFSDDELIARVIDALAPLGKAHASQAVVQRLPWGASRGGDEDTLALQQQLNAMGITPLWRTIGHELTLVEEIRWAEGVLQSAS